MRGRLARRWRQKNPSFQPLTKTAKAEWYKKKELVNMKRASKNLRGRGVASRLLLLIGASMGALLTVTAAAPDSQVQSPDTTATVDVSPPAAAVTVSPPAGNASAPAPAANTNP